MTRSKKIKNITMKKKQTVKKIFDEYHGVPPLFSSSFRNSGKDWIPISSIDYETVGRILICHLIIEHYIINFLAVNTRPDISWTDAKLTFYQKILLLKKMSPFSDNDLIKGVEIVNNIRNKFSHNLNATIEESKIRELKKIINDMGNEIDKLPLTFEKIALIELFTSLFCSYMAGYCTASVELEN
jgi:hypothetical protein